MGPLTHTYFIETTTMSFQNITAPVYKECRDQSLTILLNSESKQNIIIIIMIQVSTRNKHGVMGE